MGLLVLMSGCASTAPSEAGASSQVRPIDKVEEEIVALKGQLGRTMAAVEAVAAPSGPDARARRGNLSRELAQTDKLVEALRTNARELNERATDYLAAWGGQVSYIGTSGAPQTGTNTPREQAKARFDRMVQGLIKTRDTMTPIRASITQLEQQLGQNLSASQLQGLKPQVDPIVVGMKQASEHLTEAHTALLELRANAPK